MEKSKKKKNQSSATFLVKVKVHRGEPAYEIADIQVDKAISSIDVPTEWHNRDRSNRAVFTWQEPRQKGGESYEDRKLTWNSGVRKAIRQGSAEKEVRKYQDGMTGAWKQISKQRRRVDVSYDLSMLTALRQGTWMDEERFQKTCTIEKEKEGRHPPAFLRHIGSGHHIETGCRKVYDGKVFG